VNRKALLYDSGVLLTGKRLSGGDSAKSDLTGRNRQDKTAPHVKRSSLRREPIQQWTRRRLHEDDLVGHVLAQEHWEVLSFAAMAEAQRNRRWGTRIGYHIEQYGLSPILLPDARGNIDRRSKMQSGAMMAFKSLFNWRAAPM
jgi:hypothetical protein